jgi:uncharacterized Fe-S radical SAM superfamily protein PflX
MMYQYYPAGKISTQKFQEINRPITPKEYTDAMVFALKEGLYRFDVR